MARLDALYKAFEAKKDFTEVDLKADKELIVDVQTRLAQFRLNSKDNVDGVYGGRTKNALENFNTLIEIKPSANILSNTSIKALIETEYKDLVPNLELGDDLVSLVVLYFKLQGFRLSTNQGELNLVSIRGLNRNGSLNPDTSFLYNDRFLVFDFFKGYQPRLLGNFLCTSQPGRYYWNTPLNQDGCAVQVPEKQFRNSWSVGIHKGYKALVQTAPIEVSRGNSRIQDVGLFGINIHSVGKGQDYSFNDEIEQYSAGCTVLASRQEFDSEFMPLIYSDSRYKQNNSFAWDYVTIEGKNLRADFP
jgi:hypothetical protein